MEYKYLRACLWGIHPGVGLLDEMVFLRLIFLRNHCFPKQLLRLHSHQQGTISPHPGQHLSYSVSGFVFLTVILRSVTRLSPVVLICIFLPISDAENTRKGKKKFEILKSYYLEKHSENV